MTKLPRESLTPRLRFAALDIRIRIAGALIVARQRLYKVERAEKDYARVEQLRRVIRDVVPLEVAILGMRGVIALSSPGGRDGWWPIPDEVCHLCYTIPMPGGKVPFTRMLREHCRDTRHIAARCQVSQASARRAANTLYMLWALTT